MICAAGRRFARLARLRFRREVLAACATLLVLPRFASGEICVGDCDGDGTVAIHELITGIDIALGSQVLGRCPLFDASGDGAMTIDECLSGVRNALNGCPPTDTPIATPAPSSTSTSGSTSTLLPTASPTATDTAVETPSATGSETATATNTATATAAHTATIMPTATGTASPTPSSTASETATATHTLTPTATRTATDTPTNTPTVTVTQSATPTSTALDPPTPSTTPTLEAIQTPPLGTTSTSTATATPTPTATPLWTAVPTSAAPRPTPEPLSDRCAAENQEVPLVARKVAAQALRWLRDWATCLARSGYVGAACEVRLGRGANDAAVLRQTGKPLVNEIVCNESRCTQDLGRSLDHCQEKFTYEGKCSLDDWDKVWRWVGDPPLTISGTCSAPAATQCVVDADCGDGATCLKPSSCDVYRYGPSGWEPCRCIQEVFIKPQIDEWLADVRGLTPAPTSDCAAAAFNVMGEAIGFMIDSACMDPTDRSCLVALDMCEAQWAAVALKNNCGTCSLGANDSCPSNCGGTQIDCTTWMSWCAAAKTRFAPLRRGTRQLPGAP